MYKQNKIDVDSLKEDQKEVIEINKLILKIQPKFRSDKHNVYTEETDKIALSWNDDRKMQSINSKETYTHGTSKDLVCKKGEIKCDNIMKQYKNV